MLGLLNEARLGDGCRTVPGCARDDCIFLSQKLAYKTHQWRFVEGGLIGRATDTAEKKAGAKRSQLLLPRSHISAVPLPSTLA